VLLFADTFSRYFEPENLRAALRVLRAAGIRAIMPKTSGRPLCCGRTYLAAGMIDRARAEARRTLAALAGDLPVLGLEPSCLLTLRDEFLSMLPGEQSAQLDISKEQVLKEIARVAFSDPRRLFDNNGAILPVHDWPDDAAAAISSIKVVEIKDSEGIITGQIKHINFWDKGKHLYLIAKHLGLLNDRLEITTSVSHLIRAGRERIRMADQHEATTDLTSRVPPDSDTP